MALALSGPAGAWTPELQIAIAEEAGRLAPPDLARQIARHVKLYRRGVVEAFRDDDAARHFKNPDGTGELDRVIVEEAQRAVALIDLHRPFPEIVYQLGRVAHFVADANNPLNTAQEPREARYFADYLYYMASAQPRFAPVFYGVNHRLDRAPDLGPLAAEALGRGRALYPLVGKEYQRVGQVSGRDLFDDKSTAFGIAALSYSRALSDAANALRFVWLRAGGADPRPALVAEQRLMVLPKAPAPAGP
jgi:hypothetical protein